MSFGVNNFQKLNILLNKVMENPGFGGWGFFEAVVSLRWVKWGLLKVGRLCAAD